MPSAMGLETVSGGRWPWDGLKAIVAHGFYQAHQEVHGRLPRSETGLLP